ncbi:hypothetical protein DS745_05585 [Anaerobacillus alkaliphilus]|uniref:Uncharacterized protein n=1 Tax=Anaerobacillus alkaliphilus TaxID=1548597 RepID=A0A4Q0VWW8_9BACI|nr:hypothetical protein [Anaerobacillus alkaliphilus]RXJ02781.1 hypothetical protein DS745_05585 [Anaerobacillus alkaliphilus]
MYQKTCHSCNKVSYSSYPDGLWYCPYCKKEITDFGTIQSNNLTVVSMEKSNEKKQNNKQSPSLLV